MKNKSGKDPNTNKNSNPVRSGKFKWKLLLILTVNTIVILGFYLLTTNFSFFEYVLAAYMILTAGFSISFVVYNRGFSRRGVTLDMLPDTMTPEEKTAFIADGEHRLKKSKWMLTVILPFLFTFVYELINLYFSEFFTALFS